MRKNGQYVGVDERYVPENEKYIDDSLNNNLKYKMCERNIKIHESSWKFIRRMMSIVAIFFGVIIVAIIAMAVFFFNK